MLKYQDHELLLGMASIFALVALNACAQDRLPPIPLDRMTEAQKKAAKQFRNLQGCDPFIPPWSVLLRIPDMVVPSLEMRIHNRTKSALSPKLTEFAILIAARQWTNNYEWNAHCPAASKSRPKQRDSDSIGGGMPPGKNGCGRRNSLQFLP